MKIGDFQIGKKTFIIAEIGNNHNGSFTLAKEMVKEAAKYGADAVKFQTFVPDKYVHKGLAVFSHAKGGHKTQHERLMNLKLEYAQFRQLSILAKELRIMFLSTPFDEDSVDFLDDIVPAHKIASGDIVNIPLLGHIASKRKPVIISTGMANEEEIQNAMELFPKEDVVLLHCVSQYPVPIEEANLLSIPYLKEKFNVPVGYSDHTIGLTACKVAASLGAAVLEKHFTLDKNQPSGDHRLSMDPADLSILVKEVRDIEKGLGSYGKPIGNEKKSAKIMRRSLYANRDISKGTRFSRDMVVALRPADGLPPAKLENLLGKVTKEKIKKDTLLKDEMFSD